jgi:hypothetical protein
MDSSDVVHPADARIYELLAQIAESTEDTEKRERIISLMLTLPPIAEWPGEVLEQWRGIHDYIRSLRRDLEQRELEKMYTYIEDEGSDSRPCQF